MMGALLETQSRNNLVERYIKIRLNVIQKEWKYYIAFMMSEPYHELSYMTVIFWLVR